MKLSNNIFTLRRELGLTQEELASRLGVTNQAVSKWENGQSCPDIELLPALADLFDVTLDQLFDRAPRSAPAGLELPWQDDDTLHAVVFVGHRLCDSKPMGCGQVELHFSGTVRDLYSEFSVTCENSRIEGSVTAGDGVTCGDVGGSVTAGDGVECGDVGGSVTAGDGVECGNVSGSVTAGDGVECIRIDGDATAGDGITCTAIGGNAMATEVIRVCSEA